MENVFLTSENYLKFQMYNKEKGRGSRALHKDDAKCSILYRFITEIVIFG